MFFRTTLAAMVLFLVTNLAVAAEFDVGETVANVATIHLHSSDGRQVDQIGPGEILMVLEAKPGKVLVSRGRPGWVSSDDVMSLELAQERLKPRFRQGAGPVEYLARGNIRIALGETELGLSDLRKAVEFSGDAKRYLPALGYGLLRAHKHSEAIDVFTRAIELDKAIDLPYLGRGLTYFQAGQLRQANSDLAVAIELEPDNAIGIRYAGIVAHELGDMQRANALLNQAVSVDPYDAHARRALGRLQFEMGAFTDSIKAFEIAVRLEPQNTEGLAGRGVVGYSLGSNLSQVKADYSRAIGGQPVTDANAYLFANLGQVLWELGEHEEAIEKLNAAIKTDPSNHEAVSIRILARLDKLDPSTQPDTINACRKDIQRVFSSTREATYWDYRALAALNAELGDYDRATRYQKAAADRAAIGPNQRFNRSALEQLKIYSHSLKENPKK